MRIAIRRSCRQGGVMFKPVGPGPTRGGPVVDPPFLT
jgi:hypothetical protein